MTKSDCNIDCYVESFFAPATDKLVDQSFAESTRHSIGSGTQGTYAPISKDVLQDL